MLKIPLRHINPTNTTPPQTSVHHNLSTSSISKPNAMPPTIAARGGPQSSRPHSLVTPSSSSASTSTLPSSRGPGKGKGNGVAGKTPFGKGRAARQYAAHLVFFPLDAPDPILICPVARSCATPLTGSVRLPPRNVKRKEKEKN